MEEVVIHLSVDDMEKLAALISYAVRDNSRESVNGKIIFHTDGKIEVWCGNWGVNSESDMELVKEYVK